MLKKSERRLCEEVDLHLAYRWFCRLDLDDQVPDHSTFSVNRHGRFRDSDILRQVFEAVVRACMDAGLVRGEGFAVDASVIEANASRYHGKAPGEIDWSVPERQTRAAAEFLAGFDDEDPDADLKPPKAISPSDPCSAWTAKANKRVQFGYGLNYLIDIAHAIIVDVEPTPARTDEVEFDKDHARSYRTLLRSQAQTSCCRYRLWYRQVPRLADWHPHRPAYPGLGQKAAEKTAHYRAATSAGIGGEASTSARTVSCCTPPALCMRAQNFTIALPSSTVKSVPSRCSAAPKRRREKCPAMFIICPRRDTPADAHKGIPQVARLGTAA